MDSQDQYFYNKLLQMFWGMTPEEVHKIVLTHPEIVGCDLQTSDTLKDMSKRYIDKKLEDTKHE